MKKHEIQIKPYFHVLDIGYDNKPNDNKIAKAKMRIGDVCRVMICAEYKRKIEHKHIHFEYTERLHREMKMDLLFEETIDTFSYEEIKEDIWIYDTGMPDIPVEYFWRKYGNDILPNVNLKYSEYTGPDLDWGNYVIFSPLITNSSSGVYCRDRYFSDEFLNNIIDRLHERWGDRLIVVTEQPQRIRNSNVNLFVSDVLYDVLYVVGNSLLYFGGQTGFTHFATLCRVPNVVSIYSSNSYSENYYDSYGVDNYVTFEKWARIYSEMGQLRFQPLSVHPAYDTDRTNVFTYILYNGTLREYEIEEIVNLDIGENDGNYN